MTWYATLGTSLVTATTLAGCSVPAEPPLGRTRGALERAGLSTVAALTSSLHVQRSAEARRQANAALSTGALFTPLFEEDGLPQTSTNGSTVRGTCGITFVSPSYAVTAAHCVDGSKANLASYAIEMYRPHPSLEQAVPQTTTLVGSFPEYVHGYLSEADGYFTESYRCELAARCSASFGGWFNCAGDSVDLNEADLALLRCDALPGLKYGYVPVATDDSMGAPVFMPWKHEIYEAPLDILDDRFQHYSRLTAVLKENYHYFGVNAAGQPANQLQSLVSAPFADGTEHRKLSTADAGVLTDLLGCHGSSGSGVLQADVKGDFQLLGPAVLGNHELDSYLCNHVPAYDGFSREPGFFGLTYGRLASTREMLRQWSEQLQSDCSEDSAYSGDLLHRPACGLSIAAQGTSTVDSTHPLTLASGPLTVGEGYRVVVRVQLAESCTEGCPVLSLVDGDQVLVRQACVGASTEAVVLGASVRPETNGGQLQLQLAGGGSVEITQLELFSETQPIRFDLAAQRAKITLFDLDSTSEVSMPARFVGTSDGFNVSLAPHERIAISGLALVPGVGYFGRFEVPEPSQLRCGLLNEAGQSVAELDCSGGSVSLPPQTAGTANVTYFYVENSAAAGDVEIDEIVLVSSATPDSDGDTIPDVVDDCPNGPLSGTYGDVILDGADVQTVMVCSPAPQSVSIALPTLLNACEPARVEGALAVFPEDLLDSSAPTVELVPGRYRLETNAYDALDASVATAQSDVVVALRPNQDCCKRDAALREGSDGAVVFDDSKSPAICALMRAGSDSLFSGDAGDYISADDGDDYVAAGSGTDVVIGGDGDDVLLTEGDGAVMFGERGDDSLFAERSPSATLYGGAGRDIIVGGAGNDVIVPGSGGDWVYAGAGDDEIRFYDRCELSASVVIHGGEGIDTITSPLAEYQLRAIGLTIDGVERFVVDTDHARFSDCYVQPGGP